MRTRFIKPGIMSNEVLCDLGPYAYILFTGLWMLADREGRLEYRPKRIKALAMPLWSEVGAETVENLLKTLWKSGFIFVYEVAGMRYIQICTWHEHQHPDPREAKSKLPPPPISRPVNGAVPITSEEAGELHRQDTGDSTSSRVGIWVHGYMGNLNEESSVNEDSGVGSGGEGKKTPPPKRARKNPNPKTNPSDPYPLPESLPPPPDPPLPPEPQPPPSTKRKSPARSPSNPARRKPPARAPVAPKRERHASGELAVCRGGPTRDWWPHKPEDVRLIRDSLRDLATQVRMPPPDDAIVRRVLDAARGAPGEEIHGVLVALYKRQKFRAMYSWGFLPMVLDDWFRAA